jgi:hypothetical protein
MDEVLRVGNRGGGRELAGEGDEAGDFLGRDGAVGVDEG